MHLERRPSTECTLYNLFMGPSQEGSCSETGGQRAPLLCVGRPSCSADCAALTRGVGQAVAEEKRAPFQPAQRQADNRHLVSIC